jgi:hypothetical protein
LRPRPNIPRGSLRPILIEHRRIKHDFSDAHTAVCAPFVLQILHHCVGESRSVSEICSITMRWIFSGVLRSKEYQAEHKLHLQQRLLHTGQHCGQKPRGTTHARERPPSRTAVWLPDRGLLIGTPTTVLPVQPIIRAETPRTTCEAQRLGLPQKQLPPGSRHQLSHRAGQLR